MGVVLNDRGELLLAKHTFRDGAWGLPGGWVNPHEHPAAAVAREVGEETGVRVTVQTIVAAESHVAATRGKGASGITLVFACGSRDGDEPVVRSTELDAVAWFTPKIGREFLSEFETRAVDAALSSNAQ